MYFPERQPQALEKESTLTPHQWVAVNLETIQFYTEVFLMSTFLQHTKELNDLRNSRALSETGSCRSVSQIISNCGLPTGFEEITGRIHFIENGTPHGLFHKYLRKKVGDKSENDIISCLFTGQTIGIDSKDLQKGDRIEELHRRASEKGLPGLVHTFNEEITLVCGRRKDLQDCFGVEYVASRESIF